MFHIAYSLHDIHLTTLEISITQALARARTHTHTHTLKDLALRVAVHAEQNLQFFSASLGALVVCQGDCVWQDRSQYSNRCQLIGKIARLKKKRTIGYCNLTQ